MEDRELLEMAAKAARIHLEWIADQPREVVSHWSGNPEDPGELRDYDWNPIANNGDAFRLSVDLQISLLSNIIRYEASTISLTLAGIFIKEDMLNQSPDVAARRAIVRAAAELGRMMP